MSELLVGLGDANVLEVTETVVGLRVRIETRLARPVCPGCGGASSVAMPDERLGERGPTTRAILVWRKIRWYCRVCTIDDAEPAEAPACGLPERDQIPMSPSSISIRP